MDNPWESISLADYEAHMSLDSVRQLQALEEIMEGQFRRCAAKSVMILGVAGGNGLNRLEPERFERVYGVDINGEYLTACAARYPQLAEVFVPICCDLQTESERLPHAEFVIADLLIEYIGYESFQRVVQHVASQHLSCVIQINEGEGFVSDSPYLHAFDRLEEVHCALDGEGLRRAMAEIGYDPLEEEARALPNGKALLRLDFLRSR